MRRVVEEIAAERVLTHCRSVFCDACTVRGKAGIRMRGIVLLPRIRAFDHALYFTE